MANAVMHTTGQAFPMAFQAGGPHAQDRGLEAVADGLGRDDPLARHRDLGEAAGQGRAARAWRSTGGWCRAASRSSSAAGPSRPGTAIPASSRASPPATPVIVKPHPGAILPLALTVRVLRDVLAEEGFPRDVVLLAADAAEAPITQGARAPSIGRDHRLHRLARLRRLGAGERRHGAGLHRGGGRQLDRDRRDRRLRRACAPTSPSRCRSTPARCARRRRTSSSRSDGIDDRRGPQVLRRRGAGIAARDRCAARRSRARRGVCGAIADPATLDADRRRAQPRPDRPRQRGDRAARTAPPRRCSSRSMPPTRPPTARSGSARSPSSSRSDDARRRHRPRRRSRPAQGRHHRRALRHRRGPHPARGRRLRRGGGEPVGQPDRQHLRQPERRLQRLPRHRRQSGRQRLPDRRRLRRRTAFRAMWRRPIAA